MRPRIPDRLLERVEPMLDKNGYKDKGEFVRDAVRQMVNELEDE